MEPITFTRTTDGKSEHRLAHTPAEAVKLRFDGWVEKPAKTSAADAGTKSTK
jgi:hypothetical protein